MIRAHIALGIRRGSVYREGTSRPRETISHAGEVKHCRRCQDRGDALLHHRVDGATVDGADAARYRFDGMHSVASLPRRGWDQVQGRRNIVLHGCFDGGQAPHDRLRLVDLAAGYCLHRSRRPVLSGAGGRQAIKYTKHSKGRQEKRCDNGGQPRWASNIFWGDWHKSPPRSRGPLAGASSCQGDQLFIRRYAWPAILRFYRPRVKLFHRAPCPRHPLVPTALNGVQSRGQDQRILFPTNRETDIANGNSKCRGRDDHH